MIEKKISWFIVIFVIALCSCKTKQHFAESSKVDSISTKISDFYKDDMYTIEINYPCSSTDIDQAKTSYNNKHMNDHQRKFEKIPHIPWKSSLPIYPGTKIKISGTSKQLTTITHNTSLRKDTDKKEIPINNNKKERQFVIFIVVLIIFICLSVRFSKKIRKKFGE